MEKRETIINKIGIKLAAISFLPKEYSHVLIICHGFKGAKENSGRIFSFAPRLNELGLGVLAFDFTGNGESEGLFGEISLTRQVEDLTDVIGFAEEKYDRPLILLGRSFGGSTIVASAHLLEQIKAYIFWSVPVCLAETFSRLDSADSINTSPEMALEKNMRALLLEDFTNHDMASCLLKLQEKPVLVIHGSADEVVSLKNVDFFKQHLPWANYEIVPGAGHRFDDYSHLRDELTISWLRQLMSKK